MPNPSKNSYEADSSHADLSYLLDFACALADASGDILRPRFRAYLDVEDKAGGESFDPVTEADRLAEQELRRLIEANHPSHGVVGEEFDDKAGDSAFTWLLDPVDGTRSFIAGVPLWGTLIALNDNGRPVIGVVDQPYLGERFVALHTAARSTAELRIADTRRNLKVRPCTGLSAAIVTSTDPAMFTSEDELLAYRQVESQCRLVRYSMDCYGYCLLALGFIDLVIEAGLAPHDIQALIPIVEAAGGVVTDWNGNLPINGGQIVAAGDARVHERALRILSQSAKTTV